MRQCGFRGRAVAHEFGDAKVEQLHVPVCRHEDVVGFEVAVHHQMGMGILHGAEDLLEEGEAAPHAQAVGLAIVRQRHPLDVFHGEIGLTQRGDPRVIEPGDIGMDQTGEEVAFLGKACGILRAMQPDVRELQRDRAFHQTIGPLGQPHGTHAAPSQRLAECIGPDVHTPPQRLDGFGSERLHARERGQGAEEIVGCGRPLLGQQGTECGLEMHKRLGETLQPLVARGFRQIQRLV